MKVELFFLALLGMCYLVASRHIELGGSLAAASDERIDALASKEESRDRKEEEEEAASVDAAISLQQLIGHNVEKRWNYGSNRRGDRCSFTYYPNSGTNEHDCVKGCECSGGGYNRRCRHPQGKTTCPGSGQNQWVSAPAGRRRRSTLAILAKDSDAAVFDNDIDELASKEESLNRKEEVEEVEARDAAPDDDADLLQELTGHYDAEKRAFGLPRWGEACNVFGTACEEGCICSKVGLCSDNDTRDMTKCPRPATGR